MTTSRKVVIAGGAGFLGGYAAAPFSRSGWSVIGVDLSLAPVGAHPAFPAYTEFVQNDLQQTNLVIGLLRRIRPDVWLHFAGPASVARSFDDPQKDFAASTLPLLNVLEALRVTGLETHLLLASSAAVYGNPDSLPVSETHPIKPISPYGYHKYHQELLLDEYQRLYGLRVCKARIFSSYGPGMRQLAVWDIARRALAGDFTVFGNGAESRDYLFAEDVGEAIRCISERSAFAGEAVNVGSGTETAIIDLARMIYAAMGISREPDLIRADRVGNPVRWRANIAVLRAMSFSPRVGLEEGIERTVGWVRANA